MIGRSIAHGVCFYDVVPLLPCSSSVGEIAAQNARDKDDQFSSSSLSRGMHLDMDDWEDVM